MQPLAGQMAHGCVLNHKHHTQHKGGRLLGRGKLLARASCLEFPFGLLLVLVLLLSKAAFLFSLTAVPLLAEHNFMYFGLMLV